jgi:anti-sigma factor RsiW
MASDRNVPDEIERLNALIDGELPPAEHAALADRIAAGRDLAQAHATLARLKACVVENADATAADGIALVRPARRKPMAIVAGGLAAAAAVLLAVFAFDPAPSDAPLRTSDIGATVRLASLPGAPVIPDLEKAGLSLVGSEVEHAGAVSMLVAAYRGPRGCRLELRVRPAGAVVAPTSGTSRESWTAGDLAYELVAFGMPAERFATVAAVALAATRGQAPGDAERRLRSASLQAPPCTG